MAIGPNVVDDCEGMTEEDYWRGMDEAMQDEEGDEPFCNCSAGHSIEETDWNQCDSCGKPIYDEEPVLATQATDALKKEREAHAETNRAMTDALLIAEEREQRDEALLRQALEALEFFRDTAICEADTAVATEAIAALRERLGGEKA